MKFIVAVDNRWGIGKNGDLLLSIPEDMQYYRAVTRGKVVVMGYNTLLSLPGSKPAPARLNLVLADIPGLRVPGAVVCGSMEQLLALIAGFDGDDVFVVGGGSIYRQLTPYCSAAHITKMGFDGEADTFITNLDELPAWSVASESESFDYEGIGYSFVVYRNDSPLPLPAASGVSSAMAAYFKKKTELTFDRLGTEDPDYRRELSALLKAYFAPLGDGVSADEVREYLSGGRESFERWLRQRRLICTAEDFAALNESFNPDGAIAAETVTVTREALGEFLKM